MAHSFSVNADDPTEVTVHVNGKEFPVVRGNVSWGRGVIPRLQLEVDAQGVVAGLGDIMQLESTDSQTVIGAFLDRVDPDALERMVLESDMDSSPGVSFIAALKRMAEADG